MKPMSIDTQLQLTDKATFTSIQVAKKKVPAIRSLNALLDKKMRKACASLSAMSQDQESKVTQNVTPQPLTLHNQNAGLTLLWKAITMRYFNPSIPRDSIPR